MNNEINPFLEPWENNKINSDDRSIFRVRQFNDVLNEAKGIEIPKRLFDVFWYEGDLCVLYAETGVGKSILAHQIGLAIAEKGSYMLNDPSEGNDKPRKVIYFDFELSSKQVEYRFSDNYTDHYVFPENFYRADFNREYQDFSDFNTKKILNAIEQTIEVDEAKVIIIDNISFLIANAEKAVEAGVLMRGLDHLKKKFGISILVIAHTPKRNEYSPIIMNDLAGSRALLNFMDSAFAIGRSSNGKSIRYLKQIKVRFGEILYTKEGVLMCEVQKPYNMLEFKFSSQIPERHLLIESQEEERMRRDKKIWELHNNDTNMSQRIIAEKVGTSPATVNKVLNSG